MDKKDKFNSHLKQFTYGGYVFRVDEESHVICDGQDLGPFEEVIEHGKGFHSLVTLFRAI
ncbi:hypothetical protein HOH67_00635 [Candidatus Peregrinibacteria bacterium]|jgi:hypothetical protein|nr:hypothetical protein [Candidatus Peregrinibacteria bacterium]